MSAPVSGAAKLEKDLAPDDAEPKPLPPKPLPPSPLPNPLAPEERLAKGEAPPLPPKVSFGAAVGGEIVEAGGEANESLEVPEPNKLPLEEPRTANGDTPEASFPKVEDAKAPDEAALFCDVLASPSCASFDSASTVLVASSLVGFC